MTNNDKSQNGNGAVASANRQRSAHHPSKTLKQAEELARVVYNQGARRCDPDNIAKQARYSGANNGAFKTLRASTSQFGLIVSDGSTISLAEEWIPILLHDDPQQLRLARQKAMYRPDLYKQLIEEFSGRQLPSVEKLAQQLHLSPKYGILKDAAGVAAKVFFESASYAGLLDDRNRINPMGNVTFVDVGMADDGRQDEEKGDVREPETDRTANTGQTTRLKLSDVRSEMPPELAELFKIEIPLENERVVHIYGPRRILREDKVRIKQYIDLWLEEKPSSSKPEDERDSAAHDRWDIEAE